jgi:raffinose/stachyose/melibiose transport system permease protein
MHPFSVDFLGYKYAFEMLPLIKYMENSVIVSFTATIINVILVSMAAYVFSTFHFKYIKIIFNTFLMTLFIPTTALLGPVYKLISKINLLDNIWGLIIVYVGLSMPVTLIIMKNSFDSIQRSMIEASMIDGADNLRILFQILIPNVLGGVVVSASLCFISCWNEFTFALLLTNSNGTRTLPLASAFFVSQYSYNYTAMFAAITVAMMPGLIVFFLVYIRIFGASELNSKRNG